MSTNKTDQSGFQLNKKELLADLPLMLKPVVGGFVDYINALDVNHDGHADICQIAPVVIKSLPYISAILPLIDREKMVKWFISHDFIKDAAAAEAAIAKVVDIAAKAAAK